MAFKSTLRAAAALAVTGAALTGSVAQAKETSGITFPQPWTDPFERTAPRSTGFQASLAPSSTGATRYFFGNFAAGVPLFHNTNGPGGNPWGFALVLEGGFNMTHTPSERRFATTPAALRGEAWFMFYGPDCESHHALVIGGGAPPGSNNSFFIDHRQGVASVSLSYDGYVDLGWFNLSMRADIGADDVQLAHAIASVAATFEPVETLGLQVGVRGGFTQLQTASVGIRYRAFPGVEFGLNGVVPFASLSGSLGGGVPVAGLFDVTIHDARGPKRLRSATTAAMPRLDRGLPLAGL